MSAAFSRCVLSGAASTALLIAFAGCASAERGAGPLRAPAVVARASQPTETIIGASVEQRPITAYTFGNAVGGVLIFGGIHGDERASVYVAEQLVGALRSAPGEVGVTIVPCLNPDGYARDTRGNARGVDLNRNFPAANWKAAARDRHGAAPASEPETRAMLGLLERQRPRLIVSIHCIHGRRECNNYDGPARAIAQRMSARNGYPALASIGYPTPGSLGSFAGIERGIPVITLELPRQASPESSWLRNREALLALLVRHELRLTAGARSRRESARARMGVALVGNSRGNCASRAARTRRWA